MTVLAIILILGLSLIVFLNSFQKSAEAYESDDKNTTVKKKPKKKSR